MVNVTINMTMDDFEYIKSELEKAYANTDSELKKGKSEIDIGKIRAANVQICHVLSKLGC